MTIAAAVPWTAFATALGIGLLMGAERERRKGTDDGRAVAGIRTFSVVALFGAISAALGPWVLVAAMAALTVLVAVAYLRERSDDPGLTTETSLLACLALGAMATRMPAMAAGLGVAVTVLLASRESLHRFVRGVLTTAELNNLLVLAAATLMVLPLIPDRAFGPFDAIQPRTIWIIVILIMSIGAGAHVLLRVLGSAIGLPLAGLLSGFVSSTATIGVMGARAREQPLERGRAVAAAVLSTVATFVQMAAVLALVHGPALRLLALPLVCGGVAAVLVGAVVVWRSRSAPAPGPQETGAAFSVKGSLLLGATIAVVQVVAAALQAWLGERGLMVAAGVAGLADTHAPAVSIATMAAAGTIEPGTVALPILLALSTNTLSKTVVAGVSGGLAYARPVIAGLALVLASTWFGWWLS